MKKVIVINGPNLNLLGKRNIDVYGNLNFETYFSKLQEDFKASFELVYLQSNWEGQLIDWIHEHGYNCDGIILNAGAYSHTSIAIRDAIEAVKTDCIEVHISNIYSREKFRNHSMISAVCKGCVVGFGLNGYELALRSLDQ